MQYAKTNKLGKKYSVVQERLKPTAWAAVIGKTYPVRDKLRALGARWNPERKAWMVPVDSWGRAMRIVKGPLQRQPGKCSDGRCRYRGDGESCGREGCSGW